jgi:hypothetical protein
MLTLPPQPTLANAVDVATPLFTPVAQGGQLAEFDEYRCFLFDPPVASDAFLTGYAVTPGEASIVHHVLGFIVDPQATGQDGLTNAAIMQSLHDPSPDRPGWPCFGGAGDGVAESGLPVAWAPGHGIVEYPAGMGVPLKRTDKLIIQIHYNLADPASAGKSDSTTVHLQFASSVNRQLAFLLPDGLLESLSNATPDTLPPGQADTPYTSGSRCASDRRAPSPAPHTSRAGTSTGRSSTSTRRPPRSPPTARCRSPANTTPAPTPRRCSPAGERATRCA